MIILIRIVMMYVNACVYTQTNTTATTDNNNTNGIYSSKLILISILIIQ